MAQKMAVKSWDVLDGAQLYDNLDEAVVGADLVIGTTARRGVSGVMSPRKMAGYLLSPAHAKKKVVFLFGNEKSGLSSAQLTLCDAFVRVPIAADQPSLNLAQAMQVTTYELFACALEERDSLKARASE